MTISGRPRSQVKGHGDGYGALQASWQLPGPDLHRQATTSLRTARSALALRQGVASQPCWAHEKGSLIFHGNDPGPAREDGDNRGSCQSSRNSKTLMRLPRRTLESKAGDGCRAVRDMRPVGTLRQVYSRFCAWVGRRMVCLLHSESVLCRARPLDLWNTGIAQRCGVPVKITRGIGLSSACSV